MSVEENCALLRENASAEMEIKKGDSGRATTTTANITAQAVELAIEPAIQNRSANSTGATTTTNNAASVPVAERAQAPMAGPLQQEDAVLEPESHRSSSVRARPPDECVEFLFPHIAETHRQIRAAIAGVGEGAFQQKMIKAIKQYISGCRDEFDDAIASTLKCRKLARSLSRTLDLIHGVCTTFSDSYEYMHRMSELVAFYISCELSYAKEFKEFKPLIANRIANVIYKHLKVPNEDATKANILRMFVYMPGMYKECEVMAKIFKKFLPKPQLAEQQELPDKIYIQYLIAFYQWKQLEVDLEEQIRVIEFANRFMRPAITLCMNSTYAYHLPKYDSRRTATKYILQNLKFFQDLRNASIYDNCLKSATCVVDLSDDDPVERISSTCPPFAEIVANTIIDPVHKPVKFEEQIILATVDLTLEESEPALDADTVWLKLLRERALKFAPTECLLVTARQAATGAQTLVPEVIELDSDSEDEMQAASGELMHNEPELFSSDFVEEPERDDDNQDDGVDPTKTTCQFPTDLRTYVTSKRPSSVLPLDKISIVAPQTESPPSRNSAAVTTTSVGFSTPIVTSFPMPFIVDSFSCRRDSIHLLSMPLAKGNRAALDESMQTSRNKALAEEGEAEDEFRLFVSDASAENTTDNAAVEKVIFSQVAHRRRSIGINAKQCDRVKQNPSKKQVKFNETPIGPTRLSPSTTVKFPIKPAINVNKYNNPQTLISSTPLSRFCCSSPASSSTTSSSICSEHIKQMAQKGMTDTSPITTVESNIEIAPIDAKSITEAIVSTQPTIEGATKITNVILSKMNLSILIDDNNLNTHVYKKDVEKINTLDISSTNCNELIVVEDDAKVDVEVANLDISERVCSSSVDSVKTKSVCEVGETSRVLNNMKKDPIDYDKTISSESLSSTNELICFGFNEHKAVTTNSEFADEIRELVEKRCTSTKNIDRFLKGNIHEKSPPKRVTAAECSVDMTVVSSTIDDTQNQSTNKENECTIDCGTFNVDTLQSKCAIPAAMQQASSQPANYNSGKNETKENATLETNAVLLAAEKTATVKYIEEDCNISSSIAAEDIRLNVTEQVSNQVADNVRGKNEAKESVTGESVATDMPSPVNYIAQIAEEEFNISSSNIQIDATEEATEETVDLMHGENETKEMAIIQDFAPSLPANMPASVKHVAKDTEEENVAEDTAEESNISSLNVELAIKDCTQNICYNSDGKMWSNAENIVSDPILDKNEQSVQNLSNTQAIERKDAVHETQPADICLLTALKTTTDPVRNKSQNLASPKVQIQSIEIIPPNEQKWVISNNTVLNGHLRTEEHVTVEDEKAKAFLSLSNWGNSLKERDRLKPHSSEFIRELLQSDSNSTHALEVETAAHEMREDLENVGNEDVHEDYGQVPVIEQIDFEDLIIAKRVNIPKRKQQEISAYEMNEFNDTKPQDKAVDTARFEVMLTNAIDLVTVEQKYIPVEANIENTDNKIFEEDKAKNKTFIPTEAHGKKSCVEMFLDRKTTSNITPTKKIDINKKECKLNIDNSTTKISINNKSINKIVNKEERKTENIKAISEFTANNKTSGETMSISETDLFTVEHKKKLDDAEANISLKNETTNESTSHNIDILTVEHKKKTLDAKSKISLDNKTSEFSNETLALNLGCQQDTVTPPLTALSAAENKPNYKLNTPEAILSTTLNTKTIGNNNDLDSDLEFDFDFVFGLDFDSLTSGSTATTELSNEAVDPNATIAKEFETDKLLEALNKPAEMPVENALTSESCRQQATTKSTPLNTYVMGSPSLSSTTSSSTSSGSSCSCSSCNSSSSSSSSTSSTSTGSEKSQHPIALPDNLNVLPIELANDLLVLNDTELLPAAELLDDTAELLKEFVPIPTLETSSEIVNLKSDNNTIKDLPKICPPLEDDYELNNIMLDDESQLDEDEISWQQKDLQKNSATVGALAEEVSCVNVAALEASPKKSDVPQTTRAELDIRKSKAAEINISVEPSISPMTPSLLVSIPTNNIKNFKGKLFEKVGLDADADDDDKPSTSRAALLALAKKNLTSIAVKVGVESMECATMRKRSISELKFAGSRSDAYDTTMCNALEDNDMPIARQALLRDIVNYSPDPDNLQLDITLPLKKRRKLSEFQEDDPLNFTVPMTEDDDTIMEEITRITISHHVTEADSTEGNTNENTQLFMQLVANKLSNIISKSKPEKSKDTAAPAQSMTQTNIRKPAKSIVELKQQELIDAVMLPIAQNVVVTCEADSSVSNMSICAEGAGYTTPLTKRTSPRYRVQPPVQIVPPQLKGQLGNAAKERELIVARCAPLPASYPATPMFSVANFEKLVRLQRYIDMLMASVDVTLVIASATANGLVVNEHTYEETRAAILEQATIISSDGNGVLKPLLLKQHADGSVSILNDNDDGNEWLILPASTAKQLQKVSTAMAVLQQRIAVTGQDSNIKADIEMILTQLTQKEKTAQVVNSGASYIPSQQTDLVEPLIGPEAFGLEKINIDECPTTLASVGRLQRTELAAYGLNTTEMAEENAEQSVCNVNMSEIGIEEMLLNSGAPTMSRRSKAFECHSDIVPPQPQSQLKVELPAKGAIATLASQQQFAQNKDNATLAMLTRKSEPTIRQDQKLKQNCMLKHQSVASKEADAATHNKSKQFASLNVLKQYVSYMRQQQMQINQHLSRVKASIARNKTAPVKAAAHVAKVTDRNACNSDRACYSQSAFNPMNVARPSASSVSSVPMQKLSQNDNAQQHMQHFSASGTANVSRNSEQLTRMSHNQHLSPVSALQQYVAPAKVARPEESALETIDISQLKMPYQKTTTRNTPPATFYKNVATERQSQRAELQIEELKRKHLTTLRQQEMQSRNKQLELEQKLQMLREQQRRKKQEIHLQEQEERRQQQLQQEARHQQYAQYQLQHEAYAGIQHQQQMQSVPPPRRRGRPRKNSITPAPVAKRTYATRSQRAAKNDSTNTLHSFAAFTPSLGNFSAPMASNNMDAEHLEAMATVFSSYDIFREPQKSTTRTTAPAAKRTHLSRKTFKSTPQQKRLFHACDFSPTSPRSSDTSVSPSSAHMRAATGKSLSSLARVSSDPKLNAKCLVSIERNGEIERTAIAYINQLLEQQREQQRQRALSRQQHSRDARKETNATISKRTTPAARSSVDGMPAATSEVQEPSPIPTHNERPSCLSNSSSVEETERLNSESSRRVSVSPQCEMGDAPIPTKQFKVRLKRSEMRGDGETRWIMVNTSRNHATQNLDANKNTNPEILSSQVMPEAENAVVDREPEKNASKTVEIVQEQEYANGACNKEPPLQEMTAKTAAKNESTAENKNLIPSLKNKEISIKRAKLKRSLALNAAGDRRKRVNKKTESAIIIEQNGKDIAPETLLEENKEQSLFLEKAKKALNRLKQDLLAMDVTDVTNAALDSPEKLLSPPPQEQEKKQNKGEKEQQPVQKKTAKFRKKKGRATTPAVTAASTEENNLNTLKESMSKKMEVPAANKSRSTVESPTSDNLEGKQSGNCENVLESTASYTEDMEPPEVAATEIVVTQTEHQEHQQQLDCAPPACSAVETTIQAAAIEAAAAEVPQKCNNSLCIYSKNPNQIELMTEIAAAATSLTLLANTAASTAPIPPKRNTGKSKDTPAATIKPPAQASNAMEEQPPPPPALAQEAATIPTADTLLAVEVADIVSVTPVNVSAFKEGAMSFLSLEATPTVPAYLFNGESRDVPTPTLAVGTAVVVEPAAVDGDLTIIQSQSHISVDSSSVTLESNTEQLLANSVLSTSDHEVSSTQETVFEAPKRTMNAQPKHTMNAQPKHVESLSIMPDTVLLMQDNQVDTTNHLPESSYNMRRRTRKLSTHDEISAEPFHHRPVHKRRKTFCAESVPQFMTAPEPFRHSSSGTSPSTTSHITTLNEEKQPQRRRGRPLKNAALVAASLANVTFRQKSLQHGLSATSASSGAVAVGAVGHAIDNSALRKCDSNGGELPALKMVPPEIENCLDVQVKTSGVLACPPPVEKQSDMHKSKKRKHSATLNGAKIKVLDKSAKAEKPQRRVIAAPSKVSVAPKRK